MIDKAMILAAGRGERMRPLSDTTPKPLLPVGGKPLIIWQIERLRDAGFKQIVVNVAHLGQMILDTLDDGARWGVQIVYSDEREEGALESAGGIIKALPLLGDKPFLVVNGDVWSDYPFDRIFSLKGKAAHLVLVPNPEHNPRGDFGWQEGLALDEAKRRYTFSGIGYYDPEFFRGVAYGRRALGPLLREKMRDQKVGAELYQGVWRDVGTPERLAQLNGV